MIYSKIWNEYIDPICIKESSYFIDPDIRLIACGKLHNLTVTNENSIIIWGNNDLGQYGNGTNANSYIYLIETLGNGKTLSVILNQLSR